MYCALLACCGISIFFFSCYGDHRVLHVLTHSFPTRRSSDLAGRARAACFFPPVFSPPAAFPPTSSAPAFLRPVPACVLRCQACPRATFISSGRSEEHTSELQSLMRISYAVFCLKKKKFNNTK